VEAGTHGRMTIMILINGVFVRCRRMPSGSWNAWANDDNDTDKRRVC
jgi:hypothetical protein